MLVWNAGDPNTIVRSVPLPDRTADNDVAFGPNGSLYVTHGEGHGLNYHIVLKRLRPDGATSCGRRGWPETSSATRSPS